MKLEVHTFDPELLEVLMGKQPVNEGEVRTLGQDVQLIYLRTFSGRVKHFPLILHFDVHLTSPDGPCKVVDWLFEQASRRNIVKVMVEYQDVKMDAQQMKDLLCWGP